MLENTGQDSIKAKSRNCCPWCSLISIYRPCKEKAASVLDKPFNGYILSLGTQG